MNSSVIVGLVLAAQMSPEAVRELLRERCFRCHGENGVAEKEIFVLEHGRLVRTGVLQPGRTSRFWKVIASDEMPMDGELPDSEKTSIASWLDAGAPPWQEDKPRAFVPEAELLASIERDLSKVPEESHPFARYFSIAHLANGGLSESELIGFRVALDKLLNSLSWRPRVVRSTPVDESSLVFRIDLRDYRWRAETWTRISEAYPYAMSTETTERLATTLGTRAPYLRADWFVAHASVPPLYHTILDLPKTVAELERRLGVDEKRELEEEKYVLQAAVRNSGVSKHNRILRRLESNFGAYWKSFDFQSSSGRADIFRNPLDTSASTGGEMIFSLPNGFQAYFLADARGSILAEAPVEIVADRNSPADPVIRNGRSCMTCHYEGLKRVEDAVGPILAKTRRADYDLDRARALYRAQSDLDAVIRDDSARFEQAIKAAGGVISAKFSTEPINAIARRHSSDLSVRLAAAELGLEPADLVKRIESNDELQKLGLTGLLVEDGAIKRDAWEKVFVEVLRLTGVGTTPLSEHGLRIARKILGTWEVVRFNRFRPRDALYSADENESRFGEFVRDLSIVVHPGSLDLITLNGKKQTTPYRVVAVLPGSGFRDVSSPFARRQPESDVITIRIQTDEVPVEFTIRVTGGLAVCEAEGFRLELRRP